MIIPFWPAQLDLGITVVRARPGTVLSMQLRSVQLVTAFEFILNVSVEGVMGVATHTLF